MKKAKKVYMHKYNIYILVALQLSNQLIVNKSEVPRQIGSKKFSC